MHYVAEHGIHIISIKTETNVKQTKYPFEDSCTLGMSALRSVLAKLHIGPDRGQDGCRPVHLTPRCSDATNLSDVAYSPSRPFLHNSFQLNLSHHGTVWTVSSMDLGV